MEQNRKAEGQAVLLRWITLAVATLMLVDVMPWTQIGLGFLFVAAYNGVLMYGASSPERYARWGNRAGTFVYGADILVLSLAIAQGRQDVSSLHYLFALIIVSAGYVSMQPRHIAIVMGGSLAGNLIATVVADRGEDITTVLGHLVVPSAALLAAALLTASLCYFKKRDDAMQRRDRKLATLLEFGTRFTSGEDAARVMEQTMRAALRETDATAGYIMLVNPATRELTTELAVNVDEERPFPTRRAFGEGIEGYVAQTGKPLVLGREQQEKGKEAAVAPVAGVRFDGEAALCIPLVEGGANGGSVIGVFTLINHLPGSRFLDEDLDLVRTVAGLATMAIVNARLYEDLRASFMSSLQALAKTLDAKDPYTQGHSFRVSELCVMMAKKLRVAPDIVEDLHNGALLHDIGKIGTPDAILRKPGRLTEEEFEIMKQHTVTGYEICKPLGLGEGILTLIRNHHEKLDGTGYPDGLKLGELPLPLRIICVADAFDAMSSSRPYRKVMDSAVRNEQLNRFAGTQFDPIVIETLKSLLVAGDLDELYKDHWNTHEEDAAETAMPLLKVA